MLIVKLHVPYIYSLMIAFLKSLAYVAPRLHPQSIEFPYVYIYSIKQQVCVYCFSGELFIVLLPVQVLVPSPGVHCGPLSSYPELPARLLHSLHVVSYLSSQTQTELELVL